MQTGNVFETLILPEIFKTENLRQVERYAFLEVIHLCPISWMCMEQTSVSHSSTESEITSLDAGLRLDGIPALDLMIWSSQFFETKSKRTERTCVRTNVKFVDHLTQFKNFTIQRKEPSLAPSAMIFILHVATNNFSFHKLYECATNWPQDMFDSRNVSLLEQLHNFLVWKNLMQKLLPGSTEMRRKIYCNNARKKTQKLH